MGFEDKTGAISTLPISRPYRFFFNWFSEMVSPASMRAATKTGVCINALSNRQPLTSVQQRLQGRASYMLRSRLHCKKCCVCVVCVALSFVFEVLKLASTHISFFHYVRIVLPPDCYL